MTEEFDMNEIWSMYADEGNQSLDDVEECLLALQHTPGNTDTVARLFRAMHTYKGNARMLGLSVVESVAHHAEDLIGLVRDDGVPLDHNMIQLLLAATDSLRGMLETTVASHQDVSAELAEDITKRIKHTLSTCQQAKIVEENTRTTAPSHPEPPALLESMVFEPIDKQSLAADPVYIEIFMSMAHDILSEMERTLVDYEAEQSIALFAEELDRLHHAAEQIGMFDWLQLVNAYLALQTPTVRQALSLVTELSALAENQNKDDPFAELEHFSESIVEENNDPIYHFLDNLTVPLGRLSQLLGRLKQAPSPELFTQIATAAHDMKVLGESHGFARFIDVIDEIISLATNVPRSPASEYEQLEFKLYLELVTIAEVMDGERTHLTIDPLIILRNWCAEHIFDSLLAMRLMVDGLRQHENIEKNISHIKDLFIKIYHACWFYEKETAALLSMTLLDLYARAELHGVEPDSMLLHMTKSYINDVEIILDAAKSGDVPDMAQIEKLLKEASEAVFVSSGTLLSTQIEHSLGLPASFHKVLTPESITMVAQARNNQHYFYILRADLNQDEELATHFLNWLSSSGIQAISNVTVFEGDRTLFDFLISAHFDQVSLVDSLSTLDPSGQFLKLEAVLADKSTQRIADDKPSVNASTEDKAASTEKNQGSLVTAQQVMSIDMLEMIGELVTGQAMMQHALANLFADDFLHAFDVGVAALEQKKSIAYQAIRQSLENCQDQLEKLMQLENHNAAILTRLQEAAITQRVRPAALLLTPLFPYLDAVARQAGREVKLVTDGDNTDVDLSMVEKLKSPLRSLIDFCINQSIETPEQRLQKGKAAQAHITIALSKHEDHISVHLEDDGAGIDISAITQRIQHLGWSVETIEPALMLRDGFGLISKNTGEDGVNFSELAKQLRRNGGDLSIGAVSPFRGAHFHLTMPLAMIVVEGMVVRVGDVQYVISINAIQRIVRSETQRVFHISADGGQSMLRLAADEILPIQFLSDSNQLKTTSHSVGWSEEAAQSSSKMHLFVVVCKQEQRIAVAVDELIGQQQVLIRPMQGFLSTIRGVTGCALLASGDVGMLLDVAYIFG